MDAGNSESNTVHQENTVHTVKKSISCSRLDESLPSLFSNLYCGLIALIESFLTFPELLLLGRVSHYYRGVAMGVHNPTGMYREGKERSYVSWDVLAPPSGFELSALEAGKNADQSLVDRHSLTPRFLHIADAILQRSTKSLSSISNLEHFLAAIPAPSYGAPINARGYSYRFWGPSISAILLVPIFGRHLQELSLTIGFDFHTLTLIALRFPFLRSLKFVLDKKQPVNFALSLFGGGTAISIGLRLPAQLRIFHLDRHSNAHEEDHSAEKVISLLPTFCSMLEELQIGSNIPLIADLSPMLLLPNLTRLSILNVNNQSNPHQANQSLVLHQLTRLKYLRVDQLLGNVELDAFLPQGDPIALEEFPISCMSGLTDATLSFLAQRVPLLHTIESGEGEICDFLVRSFADHTSLSQFQRLHTLKFSHMLLDHRGLSPLGNQCVRNRSLSEHMDEVIAALAQLRGLTNLHLGHFYSLLSLRSLQLNSKYFASRDMTVLKSSGQWILLYEVGDPIGETSLPWLAYSARSPVKLYHNANSLFPYDPFDFGFLLHPVYQLSSRLPHLLSLTLSHSSALHLPSISFLSQLPHLQSLSLQRAFFLPPESLHDLRFVASTLTRLEIIDSFPTDLSARPVYLLHDILQPFKFSFPLTSAVTIVFPEDMKKHVSAKRSSTTSNGSTEPVVAEATSSKPHITIAVDSEDGVSRVSNQSSQSKYGLPFASADYHLGIQPIPPRHSSWYEIPKMPPPVPMYVPTYQEILDFYSRTNPSSYLQSDDYQQATIELERLERKASEEAGTHRLIFDSFTALARPVSSNSQSASAVASTASITSPLLTSTLLPNLKYCKIKHSEPNFENCTFVFDRLNVPRHRFSEQVNREEGKYWRKKLDEEHSRMHQVYGVDLNERVTEIEDMSYCRFLDNHRPILRNYSN